ncbi:hypothetical protein D9619_011191 [Psilocybe cf. subviscida]|uniref:Uncharacterized protein n=1 Tax=Psilocybe cf. subviscida TaxID=2480587 RepID=A0A8H5BJ22_9AGAR|nr:hypothetical protein D9619_011191 [Psilocybe cf. subviscida]
MCPASHALSLPPPHAFPATLPSLRVRPKMIVFVLPFIYPFQNLRSPRVVEKRAAQVWAFLFSTFVHPLSFFNHCHKYARPGRFNLTLLEGFLPSFDSFAASSGTPTALAHLPLFLLPSPPAGASSA